MAMIGQGVPASSGVCANEPRWLQAQIAILIQNTSAGKQGALKWINPQTL